MIRSQRSPRRVLITGGAGFIGSHLADRLLAAGHHVRLLDNLSPQVHGPDRRPPNYLNREAELHVGDVCDPDAVATALKDIDVVFHLAAAVGVGQSMYEIVDYTRANSVGTAVLMEHLIERPVERMIVASSMSIYGEGRYRDANGLPYRGTVERTPEQLRDGRWEPMDEDGALLTPMPTDESKTPRLSSIYALTKWDQERTCLITGRAYDISTIALRLFNVFGTRQALSNPYTGVIAIFLSRILNNRPPLIYEDGLQQRDFVHVKDVARAFQLAMDADDSLQSGVYNIGSGRRRTILDIARAVAHAVNRPEIEPTVTGKYRAGDIRHCFADIARAKRDLNYEPMVTLEDGLRELAMWLGTQTASADRFDEAFEELTSRGLAV